MNELQKRLLLLGGGATRYGTAGTTTTTPLASQGGLLINIDSATGDIARTTDGFIESETYGNYLNITANAVSTEFDTAVTRTGAKTLKLSTTNATGRASVNLHLGTFNGATPGINLLAKHAIPVKGSTKYRYSVWVKTNNVATNSAYFQLIEYNSAGSRGTITTSSRLTGTVDWTRIVGEVTTAASAVYASISLNNIVAGNVSDAWFDINSMTLEEVIEPVANSLTSSSPSLVSFTAVGSTDNIDQSQLTINSTLSFSTVAQYQAQQFTPTKSKVTGITLQKTSSVGSPSGTMTFSIVNDSAGSPGSTVFATSTISNASWIALADNTDFTVNLPCNLTAGTAYWLKMSYSVTSGTDYPRINSCAPSSYAGLFKYGTDGSTYGTTFNGDAYFKTLYYKPTTNFQASQNNSTVSISAREDGFLEAGKINLLTGQYTFDIRDVPKVGTGIGHIFNSVVATSVGGLIFDVLSGTEYQLRTAATTYVEGVLKIEIPGGLTNITINAFLRRAGASYSTDGIGYTTMLDNTGSSTAVAMNYTIAGPVTTLYIKLFSNSGAGVTAYYANSVNPFTITGTVDVSSYSVLKNYPTNKDIIKQYSTTLGAATTTATYRATKWGFPAIEYSATEYQFLDVDTTATGSTVAFSELGTTYTTVADGASLAISSTSTPNLFVKANITANRIYSSSNDFNDSSDKDGSLRQNVVYQVVQ